VAYATVDDLAQAIRQRVTEANQVLMQRCLEAAAEEIDHDLDRPEEDPLPDPPPAAVVEVNVARAVEWWKEADAAFGIIGYAEIGELRNLRVDGFARHASSLTPFKRNWGLA